MEIFLIAFVIGAGLAALVDFLTFKIPNAILLFLLVLFIAKVGLFQPPKDFIWPFAFFALALLVGYILFYFKVLGAGDAKFISVAVLWMTPVNVVMFLLAMSLTGAVLGGLYLFAGPQINAFRAFCVEKLAAVPVAGSYLKNKLGDGKPAEKTDGKFKAPLPYGVAIFVGSLCALYFQTQGVKSL